MVFKGFTDENGNVIPVQGAGTVYNEEKNSLALGKDTSAVGQDQFVFGRNNVDDASKVEIVGGGKLNNSNYKFTNWVTTTGYNHIMFKIGETKEDLEYYLSMRYKRPITINGWNENIKGVFLDHDNTFLQLFFDLSSPTFTAGDSLLHLGMSNWQVPDVIQFEGATEYNLVASTSEGYSPSDTYMEMYKLYYAPEYIKNATLQSKNIRTLDWEGNEKLAGSLTVGTGITVGETSLSEAELIALKALLNT